MDKDGRSRCISAVGDKIYYVNDNLAYRINKDGTNKEAIPELANHETIDKLYVSEDYYYIYDGNNELSCIERNTGEAVGMISDVYGDWYTFLNGYVYYLQENEEEDSRELWRVPADGLSSESRMILDAEAFDHCGSIVSEGDYLYGFYYEGESDAIFLQYDVNKRRIVGTYTLTLLEEQEYIRLLNACDQYVYFGNSFFDSDGKYREPGIYRFAAKPEGGDIEIEPVYEATEYPRLGYLSIFQENQKVVITAGGGKEGSVYIEANMDGSGEPVVWDNVKINFMSFQ